MMAKYFLKTGIQTGDFLTAIDGHDINSIITGALVNGVLLLKTKDNFVPSTGVVEITEDEYQEKASHNEPEPVDRVVLLEDENAMMLMELAVTQHRLDQVEQENADLIFMLVEQGVI